MDASFCFRQVVIENDARIGTVLIVGNRCMTLCELANSIPIQLKSARWDLSHIITREIYPSGLNFAEDCALETPRPHNQNEIINIYIV